MFLILEQLAFFVLCSVNSHFMEFRFLCYNKKVNPYSMFTCNHSTMMRTRNTAREEKTYLSAESLSLLHRVNTHSHTHIQTNELTL